MSGESCHASAAQLLGICDRYKMEIVSAKRNYNKVRKAKPNHNHGEWGAGSGEERLKVHMHAHTP